MSDLFNGLEPPMPPPGLGQEALGAGRRAFRIDPEPDVWSRLLRSGRVRLAWASSVALLLGGHALLSFRSSPRQDLALRPSAPRREPAARGLEPEITGIARLPRIEDRALAAQPGERS